MRVLCVGQIVADVVVRPVDWLPRPGTLSAVDDLQIAAGGCAANTACVLGKLGVDVALAGAVGCDDLGTSSLSKIRACGVDTSAVINDPSVPTSAVVVLVGSDGERSFLYREGANEWLTRGSIPDSLFDTPDFVHVGGAMKLRKLDLTSLLSAAKRAGCTTSLDTDWDPKNLWITSMVDALPHVDYLLTNEEEGRMLTGLQSAEEISTSLLAAGPKAVIVKCGADGAVIATSDGIERAPGFRVEVLDTTCAGDAFVAGFLFGLTQGWQITETARLANAAGALCATQVSHEGVTSLESTLVLAASAAGGTASPAAHI